MRLKLAILLYLLLPFQLMAQSTVLTRSNNYATIRCDGELRYYRLALPVTVSAFEQDFNSEYNNVLKFWRECEDFVNKMFVPLGFCFNVIEDEALVMKVENDIDENIYNVTSFGTELTNAAIGSAAYDVGMWVHHRDEFAENSGLSVAGGAYMYSTKSSGYAKTDKWVVAHELGHMFGASYHTPQGEGSLMDNEGEFFSYPSIALIRYASVENGTMGAYFKKAVINKYPLFDWAVMKETYKIPKGACMAIPVLATDEDDDMVTYSAIGCSSFELDELNGEDGYVPHFSSLPPQVAGVIDYSPKYSAGFYDDEFYVKVGTDIPSMSAGTYEIAFLANDMPDSTEYDYLVKNPFYSNYSVWDATVEIVDGTAFDATIFPLKENYSLEESVVVKWGVNKNYFTSNSRLRITMSADYGKTFPYVLAESVSAMDGSYTVVLPDVNVGNVDVDFISAIRSVRGGIIRIEEIGGVAYTLTTLSPESGGGFTVGGGGAYVPVSYIVSVTAEPLNGGTASVNGSASVTVSENTTVTLQASPEENYTFEGWYKNGVCVSTAYKYTVAVTGNVTYSALFEKKHEAGVETVTTDENISEKVIYDLSGREFETVSRKGVYIINGKKIVVF